ncbi:MAG: class A beta-lactamase-related serine hydrolase [Dehalococcoidia bacterium]|nr:MAG: class A beta-lactamase-related serine hydrolase [Dehalococcoidia bacterium]
MAISGKCDPKFERVRDEFERNFKEREEVGASVCVTLEGETVVDLWGGTADLDTGDPWKEDTVSVVFSSTKGATALCAHILASRGLLDIDAPVVKYWPEFGKAGKENITVKLLLNHQAGLPHVRKPLPQGAYYDWDVMVHALEEQEPFWEPGTRHGYEVVVFGWLVGEVVRRVSGKSLGRFFQDEVARPLGLDFWIGLPEEIELRVAKIIMFDIQQMMDTPFFGTAMSDPNSIPGLCITNDGGTMVSGVDVRAFHAAEIGGVGGITNARGLAGMYAPLACGGSLKGVNLVDHDTLARMSAVSSATGQDMTLLLPARYSLGYWKSLDNRRQPSGLQDSMILSEDAFGHAGAGGSIGFADPRERMSFGYTMNRMGIELGLNPRGQSLVDAVYISLGFRSNASGGWLR